MKRLIVFTVLLFVSASLFGYCPSHVYIYNDSIPCVSGLSSNPSDISAFLWIQGKANWTIDGNAQVSAGNCTVDSPVGGCDSNGVPAFSPDCEQWAGDGILVDSACWGLGNPGEYFLFSDWSTGAYDGCPSTSSSERACLLIYDKTGKYILQSMSRGKGWDNWDQIGTTAAGALSVQIPDYTYCYYGDNPACLSWSGDETGNQADIHLYAIPNNIKYGSYAAGDAPSTPLVTGFRLYFYFGCSAPTNFSTSAWTPGEAYPVSTTSIPNYNFPDSSTGLWMSRALIIDGKELPFVSTQYVNLLPLAGGGGGYGDEMCSCGLKFWNEYGYWWWFTQDSLIDGTELIQGASGDPWIYTGTCNVEHTIQFRSRFLKGNVMSCWTTPESIYDTYIQPVAPVITSIVDNDPDAHTGLTICYTAGYPATIHYLYRDGYLAQSNFAPGSTYVGTDCNASHNYKVVSYYSGEPTCGPNDSNAVSAIDQCSSVPNELALGATLSDAQIWSSDKTTQSWPSYTGATGYRLYRGTPADLANLPAGTTNSCKRYDGTNTSIDLSGDAPPADSFYWYLVTVYNGNGEGPAGSGRIIKSSGTCL